MLAARSAKALLGQVDAFMSHAWADEEVAPGRKFAALKGWAASFEESERRPPKIWLDKACIAQDNINESLACLPCFLAGCRKLLVIAGESYTTRLWCVMEVSRPHRLCAPPALTHSCPLQVFVFLQMGGTPRNITVVPIGAERASVEAVKAQVFVVAKAVADSPRCMNAVPVQTASFGLLACRVDIRVLTPDGAFVRVCV